MSSDPLAAFVPPGIDDGSSSSSADERATSSSSSGPYTEDDAAFGLDGLIDFAFDVFGRGLPLDELTAWKKQAEADMRRTLEKWGVPDGLTRLGFDRIAPPRYRWVGGILAVTRKLRRQAANIRARHPTVTVAGGVSSEPGSVGRNGHTGPTTHEPG